MFLGLVLFAGLGHAADRDVLMTFFDATGGPSWFVNEGWGTGADYCTWFGVDCDVANPGRVSRLDLASNNLVGTVPTDIGDLSFLLYLRLGGNKGLAGAVPSQLGQLSLMQELQLWNCSFTGALPESLFQLPELHTINLRTNDLTSIPQSFSVGAAPKLQVLRLHTNRISSTIPAELANLASLRDLDLSDNQFFGVIPSQLGVIVPAPLQAIYFDNNRLTGVLPDWYQNARPENSTLMNNPFYCPIPGYAAAWSAQCEYSHLNSVSPAAAPAGSRIVLSGTNAGYLELFRAGGVAATIAGETCEQLEFIREHYTFSCVVPKLKPAAGYHVQLLVNGIYTNYLNFQVTSSSSDGDDAVDAGLIAFAAVAVTVFAVLAGFVGIPRFLGHPIVESR